MNDKIDERSGMASVQEVGVISLCGRDEQEETVFQLHDLQGEGQ